MTKANTAGVKPPGYVPRIVDAQIEQYLSLFGAVEVTGTKWCGKTWSSLAHAASVTYVDRGANLMLSTADPSYPLIGERPHVIDEWQRVPAIWDTVRHAVDDLAGEHGAWILTGSSTPHTEETSHSGAGRIGRVRMHPMTLAETGESNSQVSLSGLFRGDFRPCQCPDGIVALANAMCRGGWPEERLQKASGVQVVVRDYLESIFGQSVPQLGGSETTARRLAQSLARNLGQATKLKTLAKDVYARETDETVREEELRQVSSHLDILSRCFLIDEVPGWVPASRAPQRMRVKPRRYFADPSLPVALLGLAPEALLQDWQTLGLVFENLVIRDLDVYARSLELSPRTPLHYYHDDAGLEADVILELADGRWAAIEAKLSPEKVDEAARALVRMRSKVCGNARAQVREPSFLAVITGTGEAAYQRPDGVYVIPIRALGT